MEKIKSKVQSAKEKRNKDIKDEYNKRISNGEGSWIIVDYLAEKHGISNNTVYRILK